MVHYVRLHKNIYLLFIKHQLLGHVQKIISYPKQHFVLIKRRPTKPQREATHLSGCDFSEGVQCLLHTGLLLGGH